MITHFEGLFIYLFALPDTIYFNLGYMNLKSTSSLPQGNAAIII